MADVEKLIGTSDKALYFAKTNGRNRVKVFNPASTVTMEGGRGASGFDEEKEAHEKRVRPKIKPKAA